MFNRSRVAACSKTGLSKNKKIRHSFLQSELKSGNLGFEHNVHGMYFAILIPLLDKDSLRLQNFEIYGVVGRTESNDAHKSFRFLLSCKK